MIWGCFHMFPAQVNIFLEILLESSLFFSNIGNLSDASQNRVQVSDTAYAAEFAERRRSFLEASNHGA